MRAPLDCQCFRVPTSHRARQCGRKTAVTGIRCVDLDVGEVAARGSRRHRRSTGGDFQLPSGPNEARPHLRVLDTYLLMLDLLPERAVVTFPSLRGHCRKAPTGRAKTQLAGAAIRQLRGPVIGAEAVVCLNASSWSPARWSIEEPHDRSAAAGSAERARRRQVRTTGLWGSPGQVAGQLLDPTSLRSRRSLYRFA